MNNKSNIKNKTEAEVQCFKWQVWLGFAGLMVAGIIFLAVAIAQRSGNTMLKKTATLINANTSQQVMNVDNYLAKIKTITSLFFSDEAYYGYDATSDEYDEFEKIQMEKVIENRIQDLGVLENYADFAVVYTNNHMVGWVSDSTYKIFEDGNIYQGIDEKIENDVNEAGWFSDAADNHRNLFYAKRLNENAILFVSFYSNEIESVFEVPNDMKDDMAVRLVDEHYIVLYSTNKDEIGKILSASVSDLIDNSNDSVTINNGYLVTSNRCSSNNWLVLCSIPNKIIMKEITEIKTFIYIISFVMFVLMLVFGYFVIRRVYNPMDEIVSGLADRAEHDQLTGLLNKMSFKNEVSDVIDSSKSKDINVFVMIDMDNFKAVNDTLGHDMGDDVLIRIASLINAQLGTEAILGRLGGDEFAAYFSFTGINVADAKAKLESELELLRTEFVKEFAQEIESCKVSLSAGVAFAKYGDMDFDQMYKAADIALYQSKKNGKDRFTFY